MSYWMTQSLLSSWAYYLKADDEFSDKACQSFLSDLQRIPKRKTKAIQEGTDFEDAVNRTVSGENVNSKNEKWGNAVQRFAGICTGGQPQTPLTADVTVLGMEFTLYGICDYVKAGRIIDIKKVTRYEYGKYFDSPQHPMYLYLLPEAKRFDYLIFDGSFCYCETYRREDCRSIEHTITEFVNFMKKNNLLDTYKKYWTMNHEREEKIHGIYKR